MNGNIISSITFVASHSIYMQKLKEPNIPRNCPVIRIIKLQLTLASPKETFILAKQGNVQLLHYYCLQYEYNFPCFTWNVLRHHYLDLSIKCHVKSYLNITSWEMALNISIAIFRFKFWTKMNYGNKSYQKI